MGCVQRPLLTMMLSPQDTAAALPYEALTRAIAQVALDDTVDIPPRRILDLPNGSASPGKFFVMPAVSKAVAITKLISFVASNAGRGLPTIQGDVVVFDPQTGQRRMVLDGPTVTARRTAAVSLLAAQQLATPLDGPMLVVGAGVQGRSHVEAFRAGLGVEEVWVASRSASSAEALVAHAQTLGMKARVVADPNAVMGQCAQVISTTPAQAAVLQAMPREGAFVSAVGAFTPQMLEWSAPVCQALAQVGQLVVDTRDADHEAGDFLQAGLDVSAMPSLLDVLRQSPRWRQSPKPGPTVMFKNCGWAGWDLAAAWCALAAMGSSA